LGDTLTVSMALYDDATIDTSTVALIPSGSQGSNRLRATSSALLAYCFGLVT